jgi:hypothetical protein
MDADDEVIQGEVKMKRGATIDQTGKYRYILTRIWDENKPPAVFIMLNPSTADAEEDDPTIRRCINFAKGWGMGGIKVVNVFAYRATDPKELLKAADPVGIENYNHIEETINNAGIVIIACGVVNKRLGQPYKKALDILYGTDIYCLGVTKEGYPRHPLYLKNTTMPKLCEYDGDRIRILEVPNE